MSRCFPFPPPGYEKKLRIDDTDLLAKEKHKEKKEKKQKKDKDKEKNEGKEQDKERRKEEKRKEKKEKHKDKDREKHKEKKSRIPDAKTLENGVCSSVEKVGSNSPVSGHFERISSGQDKRIGDEAGPTGSEASTGTNLKRVELLGGPFENGVRIRSEGQAASKDMYEVGKRANGQWDERPAKIPKIALVHNLDAMGQQKGDTVKTLEEHVKKRKEGSKNKHRGSKHKDKDKHHFQGLAECSNQEKFGSNGYQLDPFKETKFVHELSKRIREENGETRTYSIQNGSVLNHKKAETAGRVSASNATSALVNGNEVKANEKRGSNTFVVPKFGSGHNLHNGVEAVGLREKDVQKTIDGKEGKKFDGNGIKGDIDRKSKSNDKQRSRSATENSCKQHPLIPSDRNLREGNAKKRKEPEANGFLHDNDLCPNKLPRLADFPQPVTENGRKLQLSRTVALGPSKEPITASTHKVENKERKPNGTIGTQGLTISLPRPPSASAKANQNISASSNQTISRRPSSLKEQNKTHNKTNGMIAPQRLSVTPARPSSATEQADPDGISSMSRTLTIDASKEPRPADSHKLEKKEHEANGALGPRGSASAKADQNGSASQKPKPAHPDTKYLSQILTMPKMEQLSDSNDCEWLFNSKSLPSKKTKTPSDLVDVKEEQVWAKAFRVDSADLCVLPYVIPF